LYTERTALAADGCGWMRVRQPESAGWKSLARIPVRRAPRPRRSRGIHTIAAFRRADFASW